MPKKDEDTAYEIVIPTKFEYITFIWNVTTVMKCSIVIPSKFEEFKKNNNNQKLLTFHSYFRLSIVLWMECFSFDEWRSYGSSTS